MSRRAFSRRAGALIVPLVALACLAPVPGRASPSADSSAQTPALRPRRDDSGASDRTPLLSRRDAAFALGAAGVVALAATHDREWSAQAGADRSRRAHDLAALGRQFGDPYVSGSALLAADLLARLSGHATLGAATERVALGAACAGTLKVVLGEVIGRTRPDEPPGTPDHFAPFSRHDAMPSGHTAIAFAIASGISAEARARWLPFILYPAAGLTAWSRLHDRRHWPSDVAAGAAMGAWVGHTVDCMAQGHLPNGVLPLVWPRAHGAVAGMRVSF